MDGTMEQVDLVNSFGINSLNKDFVILSKNESTPEGMSKIYVSEVIEETPGVFNLIGITDEEVWNKVKQSMKEIANIGEN